MAAADLRDELTCSICLILYTDPVTLPCRHNFCQGCSEKVLYTPGAYSCPECREEYEERPVLLRNRTLRNIAEIFRPTETQLGQTGIFCSYCVLSPVPAAKSCLLCEASLCETHLRGHSQSQKHILTAPTRSFGERKCPQHDELLTYFCLKDSVCICVHCAGFGDHKGHNVEPLNKAFEMNKTQLRQVLSILPIKREETERGVQRLQERKREVAEKAAGETERVTALFRDIMEQLEALEKKALSDIFIQKKEISLKLTNLIRELEIKKEKLGEKMRHIEELCNMADPFSLLNKLESEGADIWEADCKDIGGRESVDEIIRDANLDEVLFMHPIYRGLENIGTKIKMELGNESINMDTKTAHKDLTISTDTKSASHSVLPLNQGNSASPLNQGYPASPLNQGYSASRLNQGYPASPLNQGYSASSLNQGNSASPLNQGYSASSLNQGNSASPLNQGYSASPLNQGYSASRLNQGYSASPLNQGYYNKSQKFQDYAQVLSMQRFSIGRHYWDVDCYHAVKWRVGVAYPSIERVGKNSRIGDNHKSWAVERNNNSVLVTHNRNTVSIPIDSFFYFRFKIRVYLDYTAGRLSFYWVSDPIRHLHTFTTKFTEPLHAAFWVEEGSVSLDWTQEM